MAPERRRQHFCIPGANEQRSDSAPQERVSWIDHGRRDIVDG